MNLKNKFSAITFCTAIFVSTNVNVFAFPADSTNRVTAQNENNAEFEELKKEPSEPSFVLNGVKIISPMDFSGREEYESEIVQKYLYKENTLGTLNNLASEITKLYRANGFLAAVAYIPPQKKYGWCRGNKCHSRFL